MAYNFRKEQKELYVPEKNSSLINVPMMKYLAVRGYGDPNQEIGKQKRHQKLQPASGAFFATNQLFHSAYT